MSKSLEDKLKGRLSNYQTPPPSDAKAAIMGEWQVGLPVVAFYRYIGALLLLVSLFRIGYRPETLGDQSYLPAKAENRGLAEFCDEDTACIEAIETEQLLLGKISKNSKIPASNQPETAVAKVNFSKGQILSTNQTELVAPADLIGLDIYDKVDDLFDQESNWLSDRNSLANCCQYEDKVIPKKDRIFMPYFETGAFFLYNRLTPNLSDDVFLSDYDAPFGLSVSRLGLAANFGVQAEINDRLTVKIGVVYSNYNQSFSFGIRGAEPDSVHVVEGSDFLEPIFHSERIEINQRVSTLGARVQTVWAVPSKFNSILASFEYHRMLGMGAKFTYDGSTHSLSRKDQFIFEIGLQKLLYESRKARLSLVPSLRYSVSRLKSDQALNVKPFSVGVGVSYGLK